MTPRAVARCTARLPGSVEFRVARVDLPDNPPATSLCGVCFKRNGMQQHFYPNAVSEESHDYQTRLKSAQKRAQRSPVSQAGTAAFERNSDINCVGYLFTDRRLSDQIESHARLQLHDDQLVRISRRVRDDIAVTYLWGDGIPLALKPESDRLV